MTTRARWKKQTILSEVANESIILCFNLHQNESSSEAATESRLQLEMCVCILKTILLSLEVHYLFSTPLACW